MKAKEGAKGTVLNPTGKRAWSVKWDDGKICSDCKSQQSKEEPRAGAPPALITIPQGEGSVFLPLVVFNQLSSHPVVFFLKIMTGAVQPPPSWQLALLGRETMGPRILVALLAFGGPA